jgi:chaperone required for assembly of F1-ATPase
MRDLFETVPSNDPMTAARRGARPALRRRFYSRAGVEHASGGYLLTLDDKPVRTPAGRPLAVPMHAVGQALAAEWEAQRDVIDPASMPLTRLANAIIDGVAEKPGPVAADVEKYLASDLLFYRAAGPQQLRERQAAHWDPVLAWARQTLGAHFKLGEGVVHVVQSETALKAAAAAIPPDPWVLGALHVVTTLTGSALIAIAMARGALSADAAWQAAHVDEDWNMEQWGKDEVAMERRAFHFTEFVAAATVLQSLARMSEAIRRNDGVI